MKDKGIDKGLVQDFNTSDRLNKGNKYGFRKMFWDYLKKLNVPFSDTCCADANPTLNGDKIYPVAYIDGGLKYYDNVDKEWKEIV